LAADLDADHGQLTRQGSRSNRGNVADGLPDRDRSVCHQGSECVDDLEFVREQLVRRCPTGAVDRRGRVSDQLGIWRRDRSAGTEDDDMPPADWHADGVTSVIGAGDLGRPRSRDALGRACAPRSPDESLVFGKERHDVCPPCPPSCPPDEPETLVGMLEDEDIRSAARPRTRPRRHLATA
jgi:hypothetical protein